MQELQVRLARLDAERVFLGLSEPLPLAEVRAGDFVFGAPEAKALLPEGAVYVERDCDLAAGKYRLAAPHADHPCWHFVALGDDGAQALDHMLALGLSLAQAEFNSPGALGRYGARVLRARARALPGRSR
jgi:hypothetical protein